MALKRQKGFALAILALAILLVLAACGPQTITNPDGSVKVISQHEYLGTVDAEFSQKQIQLEIGTFTPTATSTPTFTPTTTATATSTATNTPSATPTAIGGLLGTCYIFDWANPNQMLGEYPAGVLPACAEDSLECVQKRILCYRDGVLFSQFGEAAEQKVIKTSKPWWPWIIGFLVGLPLLILSPGLFIYIRAIAMQSSFTSSVANQNPAALVRIDVRSEPVISVREFTSLMRTWNSAEADDFTRLLIKDPRWRGKIRSNDIEIVSVSAWYQALKVWNTKKAAQFVAWLQEHDQDDYDQ